MKEAASVEMGGSAMGEKEPVEKRPLSAGNFQTTFHLCCCFVLCLWTKNAVCSSTGGRQARKSTRAAS